MSLAGWSLAVLALALLPAGRAAAGDPAMGERKSAQCVACHGPDGLSRNPLFPHLAGQRGGYLQRQLEAFRSGERYHPLMTPVAQALTPEDIGDLVAYYSRMDPLAGASSPPGSGRQPDRERRGL